MIESQTRLSFMGRNIDGKSASCHIVFMQKPRALLVRMDKLGDLVLSLCADQAHELKNFEIRWIVSQGTGFIASHADPRRDHQEFPKEFSIKNLFQLVRSVRAFGPELAVVFFAPWWVGLGLMLAGIPQRIGRKSQWHSFLFFNKGLRQSRKSGERHESDLNLELIQRGLRSNLPPRPLPPLKIRAQSRSLDRWPLSPQGYIVVHPGMAGSALNWPASLYAELIRYLAQKYKVAITGTVGDRRMLAEVRGLLGENNSYVWLDEKLSVDELLLVLNQAKAVVAPSTGIVHLAASLGTPVVGLYSPIPVQRPSRWGARGSNIRNLVSPATAEDAESDPTTAMSKLHPIFVLAALEELGVTL